VNGPASTDTDLAADLRLAVGRLARRLRQLQLAGLTASKVSALASVDRLGPVRLGDLAAAEGVSSPTLTKLVDSLEAEGLVARSADATDRRATRVALTPAGRLRLKQIRSDRDAFLEQRLAQLTPDERATLLAAIPVLRDLAAEGDR
jgi:DNA-binding MarR family transcriptional regulator